MKRYSVEQLEDLQEKVSNMGLSAARTASASFLTHLGKSPTGEAKLTITIEGNADETITRFDVGWKTEHKEQDSDKLEPVFVDELQPTLDV